MKKNHKYILQQYKNEWRKIKNSISNNTRTKWRKKRNKQLQNYIITTSKYDHHIHKITHTKLHLLNHLHTSWTSPSRLLRIVLSFQNGNVCRYLFPMSGCEKNQWKYFKNGFYNNIVTIDNWCWYIVLPHVKMWSEGSSLSLGSGPLMSAFWWTKPGTPFLLTHYFSRKFVQTFWQG